MGEKCGEVGESKSRRNLPNLTPDDPPKVNSRPRVPRKRHQLVLIKGTKARILQQIKALSVLRSLR
jgi:hypothetical protein